MRTEFYFFDILESTTTALPVDLTTTTMPDGKENELEIWTIGE